MRSGFFVFLNMILFDATKIKQISNICSPRVSVQFLARKTEYKQVGNAMLNKWSMHRDNALQFDNNPSYDGVVKIIMYLGPIFAN